MKSIDKFIALTAAGALLAVSCERSAEPAPETPATPAAEPAPAAPAPAAPAKEGASVSPQSAKVEAKAFAAEDDPSGGEWLQWGRDGSKNMFSPAKDISIDITGR
jgi:hypothetical protein